MFLALLIGFLGGISLIVSRGLLGDWMAMTTTMGSCLAAAFVIYILFQIFIGIGGFFLKLIFICVFLSALFFGGKGLWNTFNPDNQISFGNFGSSFTGFYK